MGRRLDALFGRKFKTSKFKASVNLAVTRLSILKNKRQGLLAVARSDTIEFLKLNHHEHALDRVDQVIKEQNMFDVFVMVDGYCHLLSQRANLIEEEKGCPDELKEAASSLLYAAPRCGELPELKEIRAILTARFGKKFANGAIELRKNCGVNTRMIQKLSTRKSLLENRMKILQVIKEDHPEVEGVSTHSGVESTWNVLGDELDEVLSFSDSRKGKREYRDVADAAQAAGAARAAVELFRSRSFGSDIPDSPNSRPRKSIDSKPDKSKLQMRYEKSRESESESAVNPKQEIEDEVTKIVTVAGDTDDSDSDGYQQPLEKTTVFDESDNDIDAQQPEFDSGNRAAAFRQGWKKEQGVQCWKILVNVNLITKVEGLNECIIEISC